MHQGAEEQAYTEARRILRSLFLGVDPEVHTRLSPECVVMQPEVKVALALGVEALQRAQWMQRSKAKSTIERTKATSWRTMASNFAEVAPTSPKTGPDRAGEGWSSQEDREVSQAFTGGSSIAVIARTQERTRGAISARLVRLGLVSSRQEARRAR